MAYNVFGNPITNSTLEGMPEYAGKKITRKDRAHVALNMKNAEDKDVNARLFVEKLKEEYGNGVSTLCLVYNATGDPITFVTDKDWSGHIGASPYPQRIANGQWGGYLHVKTSGAARGSVAAVVYNGKNDAGEPCDWMLAWETPYSGDNKVYTEIREGGHYTKNDHWKYISGLLNDSDDYKTDIWGGCISMTIIGQNSSPKYEAILTLVGA